MILAPALLKPGSLDRRWQRATRRQRTELAATYIHLMKCNRSSCRSVVLVAALVVGVLSTWADGYRLPNQDPEAIARGNAFVATADNPSAIYYNPAGITQLDGQNIRAGLYLVSGGYDYTSPSGQTVRANSDFQPVPQL